MALTRPHCFRSIQETARDAFEKGKNKIRESFISLKIRLDIRCLIHYNSNLKRLRIQVKELGLIESRVQHAADAAKNDGQLIVSHVVKWLTKVNDVKGEVERFFEDEVRENKTCLGGWCPNLNWLYSISKKGEEMTEIVNSLTGKGSFRIISYSPPPPWSAMIIKNPETGGDDGVAAALPQQLCRRFTLAQILSATNDFDKDLIIGDGGFGAVYKGSIDGGHIPVAIKRLKPTSLQGPHEFWTEIEMLSSLHHRNVLSLIGFRNEGGEMVLVYDYMANGNLRQHLYHTGNPPLSWQQRLEICIGAARGLDYLHAGAEHTIIHRDIKTTNILLDVNWVAKVSDFGLSKMGPTSVSRTHVSTNVKGTFGYLDPEYFWTQHLTEKSDVYAFGVVLFEVLCGRAAVDIELEEEEEQSLAHWARQCSRNGTFDQIIDQYLMGKIAPNCLRVFVMIADKCISEGRNERPKMSEVVWSLEFALQLQLQLQLQESTNIGVA